MLHSSLQPVLAVGIVFCGAFGGYSSRDATSESPSGPSFEPVDGAHNSKQEHALQRNSSAIELWSTSVARLSKDLEEGEHLFARLSNSSALTQGSKHLVVSTNLSKALATQLKAGKLRFAEMGSSSPAAMVGAEKKLTSVKSSANSHDKLHQASSAALLECKKQWNAYAVDWKRKEESLASGRMQLGKVQVYLDAVNAAKWPRLFSGVPMKAASSPQSGEKVQEAVNTLNEMMGQLNGLGAKYTERLQTMGSATQKQKFMDTCLKPATS